MSMSTIDALNHNLMHIIEEVNDILYPPFDDIPKQVDAEEVIDYLDPLDIFDIRSSEGTIYGHLLQITYGGPNIILNTLTSRLEGTWGTCYSSYPFPWKASSLIEDYYSL